MFWIVWWAWTQFTWALNTADTTRHAVQISTLASVGLAFAMAMSVGRAYEGSGLWFALPYVALRIVGLGVYLWIAADNAERRRAVVNFTTMSAFGLVAALAGGLAPTPARTVLWAVTIALDLVAAAQTRSGRELGPSRRALRRASRPLRHPRPRRVAHRGRRPGRHSGSVGIAGLTALLAVAITCLLWWIYFAHTKPAVEDSLSALVGRDQSNLARDAYSLLHFPLLCGVVALAAALEEAVAHPEHPLPGASALLFGAGIALFLVSMSLIHRRAGHGWLIHRLVLAVVTAAVAIGLRSVSPTAVLAAGVAGLTVVALMEERWFESEPAG